MLFRSLHRVDLNPLEEGAAYQQLMEDFGLTQEQLATRVGKSRSAVANTMRLLQLPASTQRLVAEGRLSAGHARALLGTPDRALQDQLAQRAVAENLTVRQVEDLVRTLTLTESDSAATGPVPTGDGDRVGAREAGDVSRVPGTSGGAAPTRTLPAEIGRAHV